VPHQTTLLASFPLGLVPVASLVGVHNVPPGTGLPFPVRDLVADRLGSPPGSTCGAQRYRFYVLGFTLRAVHDAVALDLPGAEGDGSPLVRRVGPERREAVWWRWPVACNRHESGRRMVSHAAQSRAMC
jgi:hypothetical protein